MKWESFLTREDVPEDVKQAIRNELTLIDKRGTLSSGEQALSDFDSLLHVSPESSLLLEKTGKIITLNKVAARRLGGTVDEMIGTNIYDYFSSAVRENREKFITEAIIKKVPIRFSDSRDGIIFENWIHPIINHQNEVVRVAVYASDISNIIEANQALI